MNSKRSSILLLVVLVGVVLAVAGLSIILRSTTENRLGERDKESIQAFWLAEAAVNRALFELRNNYDASGTSLWETSFGAGSYRCDVVVEGQNRRIVAHGFIPAAVNPRVERLIEVAAAKNIPPNFYDNAIYSAGIVDLNGNSYSVTGKIRHAGAIDNTDNVNGEIIHDPSINPLAKLSFEQLLSIAATQANVYGYTPAKKLVNQATGSEAFPASFWHTPPTDPNDPATGIPNVVYVLGDLEVKGNIGTIGGFYVVVGDVITNPNVTYDTTINGNGTVDGVIYTRGEFRVNGGANKLNINGGVWAGEEARLNGNAEVVYNHDYMEAIRALGIDADVQIISWKEQRNPYELVP